MGSTPTTRTSAGVAQRQVHLSRKEEHVGSTPTASSDGSQQGDAVGAPSLGLDSMDVGSRPT